MAVLKYQNWEITHNDDGAWKVSRFYDAAQTSLRAIEYFNAQGEWHRDDDTPAATIFYENGQKSHEIWYKRGVMDRSTTDGPAWIAYDEFGKVQQQKYYRNGNEVTV